MDTTSDIILLCHSEQYTRDIGVLGETAGYKITSFSDQRATLLAFERDPSPITILFSPKDSEEVFETHKRIKEIHPATQTIVLTEKTTVLFGLRAAKAGIFWVLQAPFDNEELLFLIARATVVHNLTKENIDLKLLLTRSRYSSGQITTHSELMRGIVKRMQRIAELDATVLLSGESGTGKTHFASLIHAASPRREAPFMSVSCANLPRDLIESELFGHEKGAFTGAIASRPGCFELCDKGTLFLDEIGELPFDLQPKLLTVLQDKVVRRLGGRSSRTVDVRIICATNRNLEAAVKNGTFREDLFYRINVLTLELPPLRSRVEDIEFLAQGTLKNQNKYTKGAEKVFSADAVQELKRYDWPGNVRELTHVIERVAAFADSSLISADDIRRELPDFKGAIAPQPAKSLVGIPLSELEDQAIEANLKACNGDKAKAAKILGVSLKTIYNHLKKRQTTNASV